MRSQCESFLEHMDSCKECQEELRVTHMIYEGLQSLEGRDGRTAN